MLHDDDEHEGSLGERVAEAVLIAILTAAGTALIEMAREAWDRKKKRKPKPRKGK